ncbi:WD-40 repeat-containing protein [Calothrix sp. NIES-4101]|nr:WD-40 repeat-containing protein [Calothrix sp. NIES-4101]
MNLHKFTNLIRSRKNLAVGLGLTLVIFAGAARLPGISQKHKSLHAQTSQIMTNNSQPIKPITIETTDKNGNPKTNLAISPDFQILALGSPDNTIQIRDTSTNKLIKTLSGHQGLVNLVQWSTDGKTLASASRDKTIKLWNVSTGQQIATISGYSGKAADLAWVWSRDSKTIAMLLSSRFANANLDNTIKLWDGKTGKLIKTLTGNKSKISTMSWNPHAQALAVWSQDGKIQLWNTNTGNLLQTLAEPGNSSYRVSWSHDGKAIALSPVSSSNTIKIWDATTGKLLQTLDHKFTSSVMSLTGFEWSPDSKKIASTSVTGTFIWDVSTGKKLQEFPGLYVASAVWSPDGKSIAMGGQEQNIKIWDVTTGKLLKTLYGHDSSVSNFDWSEDGKILFSVGMDSTIKIWDVATGKLLQTLFGHSGGIFSVSWNPKTNTLVTWGREIPIQISSINLWKIDLNNLVG